MSEEDVTEEDRGENGVNTKQGISTFFTHTREGKATLHTHTPPFSNKLRKEKIEDTGDFGQICCT